MAYEIQLRHDTAANWTSADPTLAQGEAGYETDTGKLKIGDGSTAWTSLAYFEGSNVTSVTAADTSIVIGGTATAPTVRTGTLDTIATQHPPTAAVALNSQKITGLADGTASSDAAAFGQIPTSLPPDGSAGGDLSGTYPDPTVAAVQGVAVSGTAPSANQVLTASDATHAAWADAAGGSISVTDGTTTVNPATEIDFTSGATVTDGGSGIAQVAVSGGGWTTLYDSGWLASPAASIDSGSGGFSTAYTFLHVVAAVKVDATAVSALGFRFNNDSGSNYWIATRATASAALAQINPVVNLSYFGRYDATYSFYSYCDMTIPFYADHSYYRHFYGIADGASGSGTTAQTNEAFSGEWLNNTDALNRIALIASAGSGNLIAGSRLFIEAR
jgi:Major tropism determinant N-terminal domain